MTYHPLASPRSPRRSKGPRRPRRARRERTPQKRVITASIGRHRGPSAFVLRRSEPFRKSWKLPRTRRCGDTLPGLLRRSCERARPCYGVDAIDAVLRVVTCVVSSEILLCQPQWSACDAQWLRGACARSACGFWSRVASEGPLEGRGRAEGEQPARVARGSKLQF